MEYLDFELEIGRGTGKDYPVSVLDSPGGEAREVMRFPFDQLALESRLKDLEIALLRSGGTRRRAPTAEESAIHGFGEALFNALFVGEIRSCYDVSYESAVRDGKGLRLKLRIQDPKMAALPWEFLYDGRQAEYVCLSRNTPLVRYLELPQRIPPLKVAPPLRILGMVASPSDLAPLDLAREKERVVRAIAAASTQGLIELAWMTGQTWRDLQREMQGGPWHVLHFVGHGGFDSTRDEGFICLCEDDGGARFLYATELARLLADHRSLRLAVLNACEGARGGGTDVLSSTASILVRRGLPAVIAMQYEITDAAAIELSRGFYEAIAHGLPVDAAVAEARKAVSLEVANTVEWGTPVLTMRTPDGVLFEVLPDGTTHSSPVTPATSPRIDRDAPPSPVMASLAMQAGPSVSEPGLPSSGGAIEPAIPEVSEIRSGEEVAVQAKPRRRAHRPVSRWIAVPGILSVAALVVFAFWEGFMLSRWVALILTLLLGLIAVRVPVARTHPLTRSFAAVDGAAAALVGAVLIDWSTPLYVPDLVGFGVMVVGAMIGVGLLKWRAGSARR